MHSVSHVINLFYHFYAALLCDIKSVQINFTITLVIIIITIITGQTTWFALKTCYLNYFINVLYLNIFLIFMCL